MFNAIFIFGPTGEKVRLSFKTIDARTDALAKLYDGPGFVYDDIGQGFDRSGGTIHGTVLTCDESDAWCSLAPHFVQLASNKLVEELKGADPAFRNHVAAVQRAQSAQRMQAMGGGPILPMQ